MGIEIYDLKSIFFKRNDATLVAIIERRNC